MCEGPASGGVVGDAVRGYLRGMLRLIDRIAYRYRLPFIILAIAALPTFLLGVGYMFKLMFVNAPLWVTLAVSLAWFIVLLGLASLLDQLEWQRSWRELSRQSEPVAQKQPDQQ